MGEDSVHGWVRGWRVAELSALHRSTRVQWGAALLMSETAALYLCQQPASPPPPLCLRLQPRVGEEGCEQCVSIGETVLEEVCGEEEGCV